MSFDLSEGRWYFLNLQPENWEVGSAGASRSNGKIRGYVAPSTKLKAFQEAVREELSHQHPVLEDGEVTLNFFLWRNIQKGVRRADATNMQKALEDALQGVVISNDRNVRSVSTHIMQQDSDAPSKIVVQVKPFTGPPLFPLPLEEFVEPEPITDSTHYTDGAF